MDTKTAEEILNSKYFSDQLPPFNERGILEAMEEYASPLKKRIEELEDILEGIKHHHLSTVKHISDILLHPSTNGKQD